MPFFKKSKRPLLSTVVRSKPFLFVLGWTVRAAISLLYATLRVEYRGLKNIPNKGIIALWHHSLTLAPLIPKYLRDQVFTMVVSKSRDGQFLSAYLRTYPNIRIIQVGHQTRHAALLQMVGELEKNRVVMITPDGPRGPAFRVKPGVCFSAQQTGSPIIPMQWQASKVFTFNTWDKIRLPRPFAKIIITLKDPIYPSDAIAEQLTDALCSSQQDHF